MPLKRTAADREEKHICHIINIGAGLVEHFQACLAKIFFNLRADFIVKSKQHDRQHDTGKQDKGYEHFRL